MNIDPPVAQSRAETFLERLRQQTSAAHRGLESLNVSASITSPNVTKQQYGHYLLLMRNIIESFETTVFPLLTDVIPDLGSRRKLPALDQDLSVLEFKTLDERPIFKSDYSIPFAIGMMYTVEGSTLGGRYIIKNIQSVLGYDHNHGAAYFGGYGNKTGIYWKHFLNAFTAFEANTDSADEIIAGADFAFKTIHNHFLASDEN